MESQSSKNCSIWHLSISSFHRIHSRATLYISRFLAGMLLKQIKKALDTGANFSLQDCNEEYYTQKDYDFTPHKNCFVLWPLSNNKQSIWLFLCALRDGVIPLVIPSNWPHGKINIIRQRYSNFGYLNGSHIEQPLNITQCTAGNIFFGILSSGTTGDPKLIVTTEQRLVSSIQAIHNAQQLETISSTGVLLPLCYSFALINQMFWAIYYERSLSLFNDSSGSLSALLFAHTHNIEMICMVPEQITVLNKDLQNNSLQLPSLKVVNFAGSHFPYSHFQLLAHLFPNARLINNYGCTEAMPRLTIKRTTCDSEDHMCVGYPVGDVELKIEGDKPVGPIIFKGSSTALGRLSNNGDLESFPEWNYSGDNGLLKDGQLHLAGRNDQIVKIKGERFSIMEIEATLRLIGFKHAMAWLDYEYKTIISAVQGENLLTRKEFRSLCKEHLAKPIWPRNIFAVENWPLSENQKTNRFQILALYQSQKLKPFVFSCNQIEHSQQNY